MKIENKKHDKIKPEYNYNNLINSSLFSLNGKTIGHKLTQKNMLV